jgi:hypothetical protein
VHSLLNQITKGEGKIISSFSRGWYSSAVTEMENIVTSGMESLTLEYNTRNMLWQYRLWSFQGRDTKLDRFLAKNQHTQRKLLNFENWSSGELSKIGHHFRK